MRVNPPPGHYSTESGMQPFDVVDAFGLNFYEGSALKYLLRYRRKGAPVEGLKKCRAYIDELIAREEDIELEPHKPRAKP